MHFKSLHFHFISFHLLTESKSTVRSVKWWGNWTA